MYANMQLCIRTISFCIRHLHHTVYIRSYSVMLNHVKGTNLDLDIPKSMYNIYFIYWRIIIYMTSFNVVLKYEIRLFSLHRHFKRVQRYIAPVYNHVYYRFALLLKNWNLDFLILWFGFSAINRKGKSKIRLLKFKFPLWKNSISLPIGYWIS